MQDPHTFLAKKEIALDGYLDPTRPAVIDPAHMAQVNYETFFFADERQRSLFLTEPLRYCGLVTDPVSRRRFRPTTDSPRQGHEGVLYVFENSRNAGTFERDPEAYVLPDWSMAPTTSRP